MSGDFEEFQTAVALSRARRLEYATGLSPGRTSSGTFEDNGVKAMRAERKTSCLRSEEEARISFIVNRCNTQMQWEMTSDKGRGC